jgi:4-alpha-glucanotransferase
MLPVGPPQGSDSPYQTSSAHAGSARPDRARAAGAGRLARRAPEGEFDEPDKLAALQQRPPALSPDGGDADRSALDAFVAEQGYWLDDYALFRALHEERRITLVAMAEGAAPARESGAGQARKRLAAQLDYIRWEQFVFFRQWPRCASMPPSAACCLFGDMPIFVAHDSAEVWARPLDFDLNDDGTLRVVAGVPPDYFLGHRPALGQPAVSLGSLAASDYRFWIDRIRTQLALFDIIRIDHFRGFEAFWEIPGDEPTAINGTWVPADGDALFARLEQEFGRLPLVAEDLGVITDQVTALRRKYRMPGMKVLQFAFDGGADNPYLPFRHGRDSVVYTGTHDNDTTLGLVSVPRRGRARPRRRLSGSPASRCPGH